MNDKIKVYGNTKMEVYIDPLDVLNQIKIGKINNYNNWIIEKNGEYIIMEECGASNHSYDREIGKISHDEYLVYQAKNLLIEYLKKNEI